MRQIASAGRLGVTVVVALVSIATVAGFLDQLSWVFEPASFFRLQYASLLGLAAIGALAFRRLRLAAIAVALAGINIAAIAPWHGADNPIPPPGAPRVRIVAFNVDGANHHYDELAPLVERLKPDILGLTELTPAWADAAAAASPGVRPRRLVPQQDVYGIVIATMTARSNNRGRSMMRQISNSADAAVSPTAVERPIRAKATVPTMNASRRTSSGSRNAHHQSP
jgi:endonuclease/exonuclease/phosphatase (EEP) superfamily protein YafD